MDKEEFDNLTPKKKRMRLAGDVLKIMSTGRMEGGQALAVFGKLTRLDVACLTEEEFRRVFQEEKCTVCAKGALLVSWVAKFNNFSNRDFLQVDFDLRDEQNTFPYEIVEIFGRDMLDSMETAFERWNTGPQEFKEKYHGSMSRTERLKAVFTEIAATGEFTDKKVRQ